MDLENAVNQPQGETPEALPIIDKSSDMKDIVRVLKSINQNLADINRSLKRNINHR